MTKQSLEFSRVTNFIEGSPGAILVVEFYGDMEDELLNKLDGLGNGGLKLFLGDKGVPQHGLQHGVAPIFRALGMPVRISALNRLWKVGWYRKARFPPTAFADLSHPACRESRLRPARPRAS